MWNPSSPLAPGIRLAGLLILGAGMAAAPGARAIEPAGIVADFPRARLTIIQTSGRCLFLDVHVAETPSQRARGLMHVTAMGEFEGMYFPYPEPAWISMWMKNTLVPLDMAFVREDGRIAGIAAETTPLSLERISSPEPVTGVLEVNGGFAARWGVAPGDRIELNP